MNYTALMSQYNILKSLVKLGHILYHSDCDSIHFRMRWELFETEYDSYALFYTKKDTVLQLVRINKQKGAGYTIGKFDVSSTGYSIRKNMIYRSGNGFSFNGESHLITYNDEQMKNTNDIEFLNPDSVRSLLSDDILDELRFQYGTLYDFHGKSFEMYCMCSMLVHTDNLLQRIGTNKEINRLTFLDLIEDINISTNLELGLQHLCTRIEEDIKNAQ